MPKSVEIELRGLNKREIELLAERDAIELVRHRLVKMLSDAIRLRAFCLGFGMIDIPPPRDEPKGQTWDNAVTESLLGSLKVERLHGMHFATRRQAKDEVIDWLQFYNHRRLHSTLGYLSPMARRIIAQLRAALNAGKFTMPNQFSQNSSCSGG